MRRVVADDRRPFANDPPGDQPPGDIRILPGELFDHGFRGCFEEQRRSVDRVGEGAREAELAARLRRARVPEVRSAKRRALLEDVGNVGIEEQKVHGA